MSTIIVGAVVLAAFAFVIFHLIGKKQKGETSCGSCGGCANSAYCHIKK